MFSKYKSNKWSNLSRDVVGSKYGGRPLFLRASQTTYNQSKSQLLAHHTPKASPKVYEEVVSRDCLQGIDRVSSRYCIIVWNPKSMTPTISPICTRQIVFCIIPIRSLWTSHLLLVVVASLARPTCRARTSRRALRAFNQCPVNRWAPCTRLSNTRCKWLINLRSSPWHRPIETETLIYKWWQKNVRCFLKRFRSGSRRPGVWEASTATPSKTSICRKDPWCQNQWSIRKNSW